MDLTLHTKFPEDLHKEWNKLLEKSICDVPFLRYGYLKTWWQTRGGGEWPEAELALVTARQDGELVGIAPLFFTPDYKGQPSLMLLGSIEVSDYLDLIVAPENAQEFTTNLLSFLAGDSLPDWKTLDWYNLLSDSPTLKTLEESATQSSWQFALEKYQPSPLITLPGDWDEYLAGIDKKQRHEIRRKMRRLESFGVPLDWYFVDDAANLEEAIEDFLHLMEQEGNKANFLTDTMREHMRNTIRWAFEDNLLSLCFLEINGKKAAAKLCFDYNNWIWAYNSGLEQKYMDLSPGWVLLGYLLRWCNEQKKEAFDFMRGDEQYKYRFGAVDREVMRATISR